MYLPPRGLAGHRRRAGALAPHTLVLALLAIVVAVVFVPIWVTAMLLVVIALGVTWAVEGILRLATGAPPKATPAVARFLEWLAQPWWWGSARAKAKAAARKAAEEAAAATAMGGMAPEATPRA